MLLNLLPLQIKLCLGTQQIGNVFFPAACLRKPIYVLHTQQMCKVLLQAACINSKLHLYIRNKCGCVTPIGSPQDKLRLYIRIKCFGEGE